MATTTPNQQAALNYFQAHGLSAAASAALVGNFVVESNVNPDAVNAGENAHGIAQWEGGRWPALQRFAASLGQPVNSLQTQLAFVWQELTTSYSGVLARLRGATDVRAAAQIVQSGYEGSRVSSLGDRQNAAAALFAGAGAPTGGYVSGADVINLARKYIGVPYVTNGESPTGFDCSGLVQYVYKALGISLPRTSEQQATVGAPVANLAAAAPGDLLFFTSGGGDLDHVAIYVGGNRMIAAPTTGDHVKEQAVYQTPAAIRRVVTPGTVSAGDVESLGGGAGGSVVGSTLGVLLGPLGAVFGGGGNGGIAAAITAWSLKLTFVAVGGAIVVAGVWQLVPREQMQAKAQEAASVAPLAAL